MDEHETVRPGMVETLRRLAATILAIFQNRLGLLVVELQEERVHLLNVLLLTAAIVVMGFFTLALAASGLALLVWDAYGVRGLFALSGLGLAITLLTYWRLRIRLRQWPLLAGTLVELKKDREILGSQR